MSRLYLLDANVFIEAARRYYAFDLVPAFWQALLDCAAAGQVCSIDRVDDLRRQVADLITTYHNTGADLLDFRPFCRAQVDVPHLTPSMTFLVSA